MRYTTRTGAAVTAATKAEAAALAAQYGLGEIVGAAPAPAAQRRPMSLTTARRLESEAQDWPRCGQGWPADRREREAAAVLAENGEGDL